MQAAHDTNDASFINNEFMDVYLVTLKEEVPVQAFVLQPEEVAAVRSASSIPMSPPAAELRIPISFDNARYLLCLQGLYGKNCITTCSQS